jgi:hypothetical protein
MVGSEAVVALNCGCKTSGLGCKTSSLNVSPPFREHNRFSVFRGVDAISVSHAVRKTFRKSENGPMDYLHDFVANRAWVRDGLVREEDVYPLSLY